MNVETLVTGGGVGGLIVAIAYAYQQIQAARRERRAAPTSPLADAQTANTVLLAALHEEREETQRLSGRVEELERQNALLYEKLREQRREYERELSDLRAEVDRISQRLAEAEQRHRNGS